MTEFDEYSVKIFVEEKFDFDNEDLCESIDEQFHFGIEAVQRSLVEKFPGVVRIKVNGVPV